MKIYNAYALIDDDDDEIRQDESPRLFVFATAEYYRPETEPVVIIRKKDFDALVAKLPNAKGDAAL